MDAECVARHSDERLLEEKQGAVWNFPAGGFGELRLRLRQPTGSAGAQIVLLDRWFNPTDPTVAHFGQFAMHLDAQGKINGWAALDPDRWHWLTIRWNLEWFSKDLSQTPGYLSQPGGLNPKLVLGSTPFTGIAADFSIDDGPSQPLRLIFPTQNGISYLHLQSAADGPDLAGLLVDKVEMSLTPPADRFSR